MIHPSNSFSAKDRARFGGGEYRRAGAVLRLRIGERPLGRDFEGERSCRARMRVPCDLPEARLPDVHQNGAKQ
jgi:hypothetical protein